LNFTLVTFEGMILGRNASDKSYICLLMDYGIIMDYGINITDI